MPILHPVNRQRTTIENQLGQIGQKGLRVENRRQGWETVGSIVVGSAVGSGSIVVLSVVVLSVVVRSFVVGSVVIGSGSVVIFNILDSISLYLYLYLCTCVLVYLCICVFVYLCIYLCICVRNCHCDLGASVDSEGHELSENIYV